jgi:hypothetical protein
MMAQHLDIRRQIGVTDNGNAAAALVADTCNKDDDHLLVSKLC